MDRRLRLVFAGTPEFALPSLAACLAADADVVAVYTQPDRPAGRGRHVAASPVKRAALAAGVAVEQPHTLKGPDTRRRLRACEPDLMVVVAYGLILPRSILPIPRLGCWNVHASLLPRWRGAAPIQRALLAGDRETGVAVMKMEAGLDTGPLLDQRRTPILPTDTAGSLHDRLASLGADLLAQTLADIVRGGMPGAVAQATAGVTYAAKIDKAEARLDWFDSAAALALKVRAFDPWPVAEADIGGEHLRIRAAADRGQGPREADRETQERQKTGGPGAGGVAPGTILAAGTDGVDVACGAGVLRVTEVQRPGGRRMPVRDWLNARPDLRTRR
ncbi:MAG TPA: methionyl-tRNA formyltransferase [Rhodanobacteraceae bacterium]|nr:methionyl-tRNA formyltransferase [Rhodanobacteraceae bacterium]